MTLSLSLTPLRLKDGHLAKGSLYDWAKIIKLALLVASSDCAREMTFRFNFDALPVGLYACVL